MIKAQHLELLVEERSMKAFLDVLLPRLLPDRTFLIYAFEGKRDLLKNLLPRLQTYKNYLPSDWRLFVMVDQNGGDCRKLKAQLEEIAHESRLITRTRVGKSSWQVVNRIVIQELEAWYFGDWEAVCRAYPRLKPGLSRRARYRDPDGIRGTWEAFERILRRNGYFKTGLRKIEAAQAVANHFNPARNRSQSFRVFLEAVYEAVEQPLPDKAAIPCRKQ